MLARPARPKLLGICFRRAQRAGGDVGADAGRGGQLVQQRQQDRAGAGADVGDAQRLERIAAGANEFERRLDHGFRIRARHQRVGGEREAQAPEFLLAEDARDRFVLQPPLHQRGEAV